jgi:1-acyl-sn-glycerol-3-phosphate acyltransferase
MRSIVTAIIFPFLMIFSFGILAPVAAIAAWWTGSGAAAHRVARFWADCVLVPAGIRVHVTGRENVPSDRPVIFACNHISQCDIPVLYRALPVEFRFVVKKELFRIPYLGMAMKASGYIPVNRSGGKAALRSLNEAAKRIRSGASIVIFPEGTRSVDGSLGPFKSGAFLLALKSGCPVIPVAISGTQKILPKGSLHARSGDVFVSIGKEISLERNGRKITRDELSEVAREAVLSLKADLEA